MLLRPRQQTFVEHSVEALKEHGNTLGVAPTGCHAPGTDILMFNGTTTKVEELEVGDEIMGPDSKPRIIQELHNGVDEMFEIRPLKGDPFIVNRGHILSLVQTNKTAKDTRYESKIANISVDEYLRKGKNFKHDHKLYRAKINFNGFKNLPIEPYFLGILLGDGCLKSSPVNVTTPDPVIVEYCQEMADKWDLRLNTYQMAGNEANTYSFVKDGQQKNPLTDWIRNLGIYGIGAADKHIPHHYKVGSDKVRAAVLAGLLDTDGYKTNNIMEFSTASKRLAYDVAFVARSLGFLAIPRKKIVNERTYYRFCISGDFSNIPLRIARKIPEKRKQKKSPLRTGFTVHHVGQGEYYGFTVDKDNLYVMGDFTVTHNSGKTIMLSGVVGEILKDSKKKACVLAHRDELTSQNIAKFSRVNPGLSTSVIDSNQKSWDGRTTFAMVQTLARDNNINAIPSLDLLVIDEAHHAVAGGYQRIINKAKEVNPHCMIYGVTATPMRGDKKGLRSVFSNVADQIMLTELIKSGHLVPPRTFAIDVGVQKDLKNVKKVASDFDMGAVEKIMNKRPITDAVIEHWQDKAGDRKTIVFCSTIAHAQQVHEAFISNGVDATLVHGELSKTERQQALENYEKGNAQVIINVAVLTEGYDYTPTSCVILLRPSSHRSTMIQMIGRGLRTVDPAEFPGVIKNDCVVLDFGTSTLIHGSLEQSAILDFDESEKREAPKKDCPDCGAVVPLAARECSLCGYEWEDEEEEEEDEETALTDFVMCEIDLLEKSPFSWCDLFGDDESLVANGFNAWGGVFYNNNNWYAIGGGKGCQAKLLAIGQRTICLAAADDWLNQNESADTAHKTKRWLYEAATYKQRQYLPPEQKHDYGLTRYHASALLTFQFNKKSIKSLVFNSRGIT